MKLKHFGKYTPITSIPVGKWATLIFFSFPGVPRIAYWAVKHKKGSIEYRSESGHIEVKKTGYYFIYSQMFYYDGTALQMGHYTYINHDKVLESLGSVVSDRRKYNTKYHGGVFLLRANDTLSVHITHKKVYYMVREGSFFGAFLVHE